MKQSFKKGFGVTLGTLTANLLFTIAAKLAAEKLRNSSLEGEAKPEEEGNERYEIYEDTFNN